MAHVYPPKGSCLQQSIPALPVRRFLLMVPVKTGCKLPTGVPRGLSASDPRTNGLSDAERPPAEKQSVKFPASYRHIEKNKNKRLGS
ncbi:hypothetical protein, partial [Sphingobacterium sp. UBA7625]